MPVGALSCQLESLCVQHVRRRATPGGGGAASGRTNLRYHNETTDVNAGDLALSAPTKLTTPMA
jgi:hypothetical protein